MAPYFSIFPDSFGYISTLNWFLQLNIIFSLAIVLRILGKSFLFDNDPVFIFSSPAIIWTSRLKSIFNPYEPFTIKARIGLLLRYLCMIALTPYWIFWWTVDDLIFNAYRSLKNASPIFILGGFRTGSTSLHRTMSDDANRFVTPRVLELIFPFLTFHYFLDMLEYCDKKIGTKFIDGCDQLFKTFCGEEVIARHPMSYYAAEEDDMLFAINLGVGWYAGIQFPSRDVWMHAGQVSTYTKEEKKNLFKLYQRCIQKVLYRRGNGRTFLSKSHLIEFVELLSDNIPDAKFIDIVRHPKDSIVSWMALQSAGSRRFVNYEFPKKEGVAAHLEFWDKFFAKEMEYFNEPPASIVTPPSTESRINKIDNFPLNGTSRPAFNRRGSFNKDGHNLNNRIQVTFKDYHLNPVKCTKDIYDQWNIPFTKQYEALLQAKQKEHDQYKQKQGYKNPDLKDLDLTMEMVEKRYEKYIDTVGLSTKMVSPTAPVINPKENTEKEMQKSKERMNQGSSTPNKPQLEKFVTSTTVF